MQLDRISIHIGEESVARGVSIVNGDGKQLHYYVADEAELVEFHQQIMDASDLEDWCYAFVNGESRWDDEEIVEQVRELNQEGDDNAVN